jgi:hypothetical protein
MAAEMNHTPRPNPQPRPLEYYRPVHPPEAEALRRRRLLRDAIIYIAIFVGGILMFSWLF